MTLDVAASGVRHTDRQAPGASGCERSAEPPRLPCYDVYSLRVVSEVPLPVGPSGTALAEPAAEQADLLVRRSRADAAQARPGGAPARTLRCGHGTIVTARYEDARGSYLHYPSAGGFTVTTDGARVLVHRNDSPDESLLRLLLACQVLIFALHRRGIPSLHASAVNIGDEAILFLGPKGRGKSTMAAGFLQRGASLLTDDALPLEDGPDGIYGVPSLPLMKLWRETAEGALDLTEPLPPVATNAEKRLLLLGDRYPLAQQPVRIRAIYVLERVDPDSERPAAAAPIAIQPLSGHAGVAALLGQTSLAGLLLPAETALLLRRYARLVSQAPARLLRYPNGFEHQDAVHAAVLADLATA